MTATAAEPATQTLEVTKEEYINASPEAVFEAILEEMGPQNQTPDGVSLSMKIEPWPGGRWYRDLGNNSGHLWGHVQSIKRPALLEIYGPLFMSAPVSSHVIYRLAAEGSGTRLTFSHRAVGLIASEHRDASRIQTGWSKLIERVRSSAEGKADRRR